MEEIKDSMDVRSNAGSLDTVSSSDLILDVDLAREGLVANEDAKGASDLRSEGDTVSSETCDQSVPLCQSVDSILDYLGQFGRFQQLLYFMLWLPAASMAAGVYAAVYMEWSPSFTCAQEEDNQFGSEFDGACLRSDNVTSCSHYDYDPSIFTSTVVTEFNLVCDRQYIQTLSKTIYMMGMLVGSFVFGWLGDKCGRRAAFLATTVCLTLGSVGCAVSPNVETYIVARFITSCGGMGIFITVFVLSMEFIGPKFRTMCGVAIQIPFALGELYIVLIAYLVRDWRVYQAVVAAPFFIFFVYVFFIPESVRWLISRERREEAKIVLARVAKVNKVIMPRMDEESDSMSETEEDCNTKPKQNIGISQLITNSTMRLRFIVMAFNWVVATLGYYGLSLSSAGLSSDPFTSFALSATMEIPAYLFCISCLDRAGRKSILAFSQILAGSTCLVAALLPAHLTTLTTILTLVGKFGASASFAIVFIFTAELFPTPVRNSAIGLCSTSARIGGLMAPTIASLATTNPLLPFLIMGCCSCVGGLAALLLPETSGLPLPDTVEEAVSIGSPKHNYRDNLLVASQKLIQTENSK
jgi:OCT family organic cation transporter-like MFS transporter 4/5